MLILGNNSAYAPDLFAGATGSASTPTPSIPTTLGSRIDNKATVVGVLQDHEGNDYVLAVVDAAYRSGTSMSWGTYGIDTPLDDHYPSSESALADHHTGKYNTDVILSTYSATDYPAFNFAKNACSVTLNGMNYYSVLPNLIELNLIYENKDVLDQYDPTATTYTGRTISGFKCGGDHGLWSSTESNKYSGWTIVDAHDIHSLNKGTSSWCGVCPVICISLS